MIAANRQIRKIMVYPTLQTFYTGWDRFRGRIRGGAHPSHKTKLRCIRRFQNEFNLPVFVETGTYLGHTVRAVKNDFQYIYSIELNEDLFSKATLRFSKCPYIHIIQGDSGNVLPELLSCLEQKCLFWLDAHYWGGVTEKLPLKSPIVKELEAIGNHPIKDHVILIDDARLFKGKNGWLSLESVFSLLRRINPKYTIEVKNDIVRAYSNGT